MFIDFGNKITPTKMISSYMLSKSSVGVLTQQSNRSCWGIALKTSGKTYYTQNGKRILSDQNHVILLPKGSCYTWKCFEQGECILINFDALEEGDTIYSIEVNDNSFILSAFSEIERCLNLDDSISQLSAMQQLYGILLFLAKATNKKYIPFYATNTCFTRKKQICLGTMCQSYCDAKRRRTSAIYVFAAGVDTGS